MEKSELIKNEEHTFNDILFERGSGFEKGSGFQTHTRGTESVPMSREETKRDEDY